jgi:hypothetical protein
MFTTEDPKILASLAPTLQLDVAEPDDGTRLPAQKTKQASGNGWLAFSPNLIYLFLVAIPAYLGALAGYSSGDEPKMGAARGAGKAVFSVLLACTLLGTVAFLIWGAGQPRGSGVMTPFVLGLLVFIIGLPAGALLSACMGLMTALFAYQGARQGPHLAGIAAALGAPLGLVLMGILLWIASGAKKKKRNYSVLPLPVLAVAEPAGGAQSQVIQIRAAAGLVWQGQPGAGTGGR